MTKYTAIGNSEVDTDSPITESLITRLRDNPLAQFEGAAGAPKIADAAFNTNSINGNKLVSNSVTSLQIGSTAVHTSELNTSTASVSTSSILNFTMTGGMYVFAPQFRVSTGTGYFYGTGSTTNANTSSTGFITACSIAASGNTIYSQWRYVAASPPHDMGDGDIPAFIYAVIDNATGDIESISSAADPVWLANGPTDAMPTIRKKNGLFKRIKEIPPEFENMNKLERARAVAALPDIEIEITEQLKHADMDIVPHPFIDNDLSGKTVVMLDPVSDTVRELSEIESCGEDIHDIIRGGYLKIGNTGLKRVTPAGLLIPATTWKKTAI